MSHDVATAFAGRRTILVAETVDEATPALRRLGELPGDVEVLPAEELAEAVRQTGGAVVVVLWDRVDAATLATIRGRADVELVVAVRAVADGLVDDDLRGLALVGVGRLGDTPVLLVAHGDGAPLTVPVLLAAPMLATAPAGDAPGPGAQAGPGADTGTETETELAVARTREARERASRTEAEGRVVRLEEDLRTARARNDKLVEQRAKHEETMRALGRHWLGRRAIAAQVEPGARRPRPSRTVLAAGAVAALVTVVALLLWQGLAALVLLVAANTLLLTWLAVAAREAMWERQENRLVSDAAVRRLDRALKTLDGLARATRAASEEAGRRSTQQEARLADLAAASHEARRAVERCRRD